MMKTAMVVALALWSGACGLKSYQLPGTVLLGAGGSFSSKKNVEWGQKVRDRESGLMRSVAPFMVAVFSQDVARACEEWETQGDAVAMAIGYPASREGARIYQTDDQQLRMTHMSDLYTEIVWQHPDGKSGTEIDLDEEEMTEVPIYDSNNQQIGEAKALKFCAVIDNDGNREVEARHDWRVEGRLPMDGSSGSRICDLLEFDHCSRRQNILHLEFD